MIEIKIIESGLCGRVAVEPDGFIHDLFVPVPKRKKGYAKKLLDLATAIGGNCLFVKSRKTRAIQIYEQFGFYKTDEPHENPKIAGFVMRLSLPQKRNEDDK